MDPYRTDLFSHPLSLLFTEWSGINALLYYGPMLVQEIGLKGDTVGLVVSGGIGIVQFIAVLPAIAYIDRVGRKALLRGSCLFWFTRVLFFSFGVPDRDRTHSSGLDLTLM